MVAHPFILPPVDTFQNYTCHACQTLSEQTPEGRFLFNQKVFLQHQSVEKLVSFRLDYIPENRLVALVHIFIQQEEAISPWRGTFGGIEYLHTVSEEVIIFFLNRVDFFLHQNGIASLRLVTMPHSYMPIYMYSLPAILLRHGYTVSIEDINYHIPISTPTLLPRMHSSEKRRIHKCQQAGMIFEEPQTPDLAVVYAFIRQARIRKGFPITLTYEDFVQLFERLPEVYRIFIVRDQDSLAALTVTVKISETVLYNFYPADNEHYLSYSPSVFLLANLYEKAYQEGYTLLDLGIATDKGQVNHGLMRFKKNMGGEPSTRLTFQKHIIT